MKVPFSKLSGCGNDFILIDNCDRTLSATSPTWLTALCHRHEGIGADGVIWLESASNNSASIRLYNADGSEAASCGNAFRCLLTYLKNRTNASMPYTIHTPFTLATASWEQNLIRIELQDPSEIQWNMLLQLDDSTLSCHFLNTGVPHLVVFVEDLEAIDVTQIGKALRRHPRLMPHGANVNFVTLQTDTDQVHYRTYERGVEAETLACGTGAVAVALACSQIHSLASPIRLTTRSGEILQVDFSVISPNQFHHVSLLGPAKLVYEGNIELG